VTRIVIAEPHVVERTVDTQPVAARAHGTGGRGCALLAKSLLLDLRIADRESSGAVHAASQTLYAGLGDASS
jgi:hypothetical protein